MTSNIDHYPPIGRLTAIGDGYSLALLGPDAAVEWWCPLRFDADPFVWPLLDRHRGGTLRIGPAGARDADEIAYEPGTAIATHTWHLATGTVRVTSAMSWPRPRSAQELLFHAEVLAGDVTLEAVFSPAPQCSGAGRGPSSTAPRTVSPAPPATCRSISRPPHPAMSETASPHARSACRPGR